MLEFEVQNKNFRTSPTLLLEKNRIQRDNNAYNQVYLSLLDQFELAKIDSKIIQILSSILTGKFKIHR